MDIISYALSKKYAEEIGSGIADIRLSDDKTEIIFTSTKGAKFSIKIEGLHTHDNLEDVLNKFEIIDNNLYFNNKKILTGNVDVSKVHDHNNKEYLDKIGQNSNGDLTYNGNTIKGNGKDVIDDTQITNTTVYSSEKIENSFVKKEAGKSLVSDINISKIHEHNNKEKLDKIGEDENGNITYGNKGIDYEALENIPSINGVKIKGSKSLNDLGIQSNTDNTLVTTDKTIKGAINEINNSLLDTITFTADGKSIIYTKKDGTSIPILISDIFAKANLEDLKNIDITNRKNNTTLKWNSVTNKYEHIESSSTDELVKMSSDGNAGYLGDFIDNQTIKNVDGILKAKTLDGLEATITELNYIKGLTMPVQDLVTLFANGGVKYIDTPFPTKADLDSYDTSSLLDGIGYLVRVLVDETQLNHITTYLLKKNSTPVFYGIVDNQRDFTTNPINLENEITGKLDSSHIDVDDILTSNINDTYKIATPTNKPFSTNGAKALYDEIIEALGNKANNDDITTHTNDTEIHVNTVEKETWNNKQDKLTFDEVPTEDSTNPITSGGVKTSLNNYVEKEDSKSLVNDTDIAKIHEHTNYDKLEKIDEDLDGNLIYNGKSIKTDLPIATNTTLGGIKVGNNLTINEDGVLSAKTGGSAGIDDENTSTSTTYSSNKIESSFVGEIEGYTDDELKAMLGLSEDDKDLIKNLITDDSVIDTTKTWNSSVLNKKFNNIKNKVNSISQADYNSLIEKGEVDSTVPYLVTTNESLGAEKKALLYYNNQLYNFANPSTDNNEIQQKVSLNATKNNSVEITTVDSNNKLMIENYKFIKATENTTSIVKKFNNSNKDNFIYNPDEIDFDDNNTCVKNKYVYDVKINSDGLYESEVINKSDFLEIKEVM